ncbi:MAG: superoxide dismutase [Polyangiaceae bacterium]
MSITLPELPYAKDALAPHISNETLEFHYGKHHAGYVKKLNAAIESDSSLAGKSLEDLIKTQKGGVFNNAAQIWNHTFYWNSMSPNGGGEPSGAIAEAINKSFGSFSDFKEKFSAAAGGHFGSGWAWVVKEGDKLAIVDTHDAGNPLTEGKKPVLTCDVWEHAYYIDYRNARPDYISAWWNLVNWDFASKNLG